MIYHLFKLHCLFAGFTGSLIGATENAAPSSGAYSRFQVRESEERGSGAPSGVQGQNPSKESGDCSLLVYDSMNFYQRRSIQNKAMQALALL